MDTLDVDDSVSLSEFKNNPAQVPVDEPADSDLVEIVRERLTRRHTAIDVDIDQI